MNPVHKIYPIRISNRSDKSKKVLLLLRVNKRCSKRMDSSICFKFTVILKYVKLPCINSTHVHVILVRIFFPCSKRESTETFFLLGALK